MPFIGIIIALIASTALSLALQAFRRPKEPKAGTIDAPRTDESESIAAIFGTVKIAPNVVWWGDVTIEPIKGDRRVLGLVGPRPTLGYRYFVGMQGVLCWGPVDELVEIIVDDKQKLSTKGPFTSRAISGGGYVSTTSQAVTPALPIAAVTNGRAIDISAADLFGGKELEGGILGRLTFYFGNTQNVNTYLQSHIRNPYSAYPGLCYAAWEHVYIGTSPYLKAWAFVLRRRATTLGALAGDTTLSRIGNDANPAEVLYELWTDARWGLGESAAALDTASFITALQTLKTEGLGISGPIADGAAEETVNDILRTIDGVLAESPTTGKLTLKLLRPDYDVDTLEVFTPSNSEALSFSRPDWDTLATEVHVTYTDAAQDFTTRTRVGYNPAVRQAIGKARGVTADYPLITTGANAEALATRDARAVSANLVAGSITLPRVGSILAPGDPFIIDWPDQGLPRTVVRGKRFNYGTIHGTEVVQVDFAQDVFGVPGGVFLTDPPADWTPPTPTDAGRKFEVESTITLSDTQGCLGLSITGDISSITLVETRTQVGGAAAGAWTTQSNAAPISVCIARDAIEVGRIAYRISYTDGDGTTQTLEGEEQVPPLGSLAAPVLALEIDGSGSLTASVPAPASWVTSVKFAVSAANGSAPSLTTIRAASADSTPPFSAAAMATMVEGERRIVGALAYDVNGRESAAGYATITRGTAPGGGSGGISTGTPGLGCEVFFAMGASFVSNALHPSGEEAVECGVLRINANAIGYMRLEATVITAGASTAKYYIKYSIDDGNNFSIATGIEVGLSVASTVKPRTGAWIDLATIASGAMRTTDLILKLYRSGGDSSASPDVYDCRLRYTPTVATGGAAPPTPQIPTSNPTLLADWDPTEGTGTTLADKSGNGRNAGLGSGGQNPGWVADPTRAIGPFGSGGSFLLKCAFNSSLPWNVGGGANDLKAFSLSFYLKFSSLPGANAWIFRMTSSGGSELTIQLLTTGAVQVSRNTAGGVCTATSSVLTAGNQYLITVTNAAAGGGKVRIYVNGAFNNDATMPVNTTAFATQPTLLWGADNTGFTSATGVPGIIGRTIPHDGELSAVQVASIYAAYRANVYPGLP